MAIIRFVQESSLDKLAACKQRKGHIRDPTPPSTRWEWRPLISEQELIYQNIGARKYRYSKPLIWCMFSIKSSSTSTIWFVATIGDSARSMEIYIFGFDYRSLTFQRSWCHSYGGWSFYQAGTLPSMHEGIHERRYGKSCIARSI